MGRRKDKEFDTDDVASAIGIRHIPAAARDVPDAEEWPGEALRSMIRVAVSMGTDERAMCHLALMDGRPISVGLLRDTFADELNTGADVANATVGHALFVNAVAGDVKAQTFWLKARAGWIEAKRLEVTGKDGDPIEVRVRAEAAVSRAKDLLKQMADKKREGAAFFTAKQKAED